MVSYIAVFRGRSVSNAQLIAVSADPQLVARVAGELLEDNTSSAATQDPVINALNSGRRCALRLVAEQEGADHV